MPLAQFETSADTRLIYQELAKTDIGEICTYERLSASISRAVVGGEGCLARALRRLRREDRIIFVAVRGVGYKRLADTDIVRNSRRDTDSLRRKARVAASKLTAVENYSGLSAKEQLEYTARLTVFSVISSVAAEKSVVRLEAACSGRSRDLSITETLQIFTEK